MDTVAVAATSAGAGTPAASTRSRTRNRVSPRPMPRAIEAPVSRAHEIASSSPPSTGTDQTPAAVPETATARSPLRSMTSTRDRAWPPAPRTTQSVMGEPTGLPCWHPIVPAAPSTARGGTAAPRGTGTGTLDIAPGGHLRWLALVVIRGMGSIGRRHARVFRALGHEVLGWPVRPRATDDDDIPLLARGDALETAAVGRPRGGEHRHRAPRRGCLRGARRGRPARAPREARGDVGRRRPAAAGPPAGRAAGAGRRSPARPPGLQGLLRRHERPRDPALRQRVLAVVAPVVAPRA